MLTFFKNRRARDRQSEPVVEPVNAASQIEWQEVGERYLTDGVELYRFLGSVARGSHAMLGVENCRTFEILLIPTGDLRRGRLRAVPSAPGESAAQATSGSAVAVRA